MDFVHGWGNWRMAGPSYNRMQGSESEWDWVGWDPMGGTLGAQRDPMGGDPWEREPLGAQGIPWEGTLGIPHWEPFGGPRTNLEVFCDEVTFQEFPNS